MNAGILIVLGGLVAILIISAQPIFLHLRLAERRLGEAAKHAREAKEILHEMSGDLQDIKGDLQSWRKRPPH